MIRAEVINEQSLCDHLVMKQVAFDAKGSHMDIVVERETIIESFNADENYHLDLMNIIDKVIEKDLKELEKLKKGDK